MLSEPSSKTLLLSPLCSLHTPWRRWGLLPFYRMGGKQSSENSPSADSGLVGWIPRRRREGGASRRRQTLQACGAVGFIRALQPSEQTASSTARSAHCQARPASARLAGSPCWLEEEQQPPAWAASRGVSSQMRGRCTRLGVKRWGFESGSPTAGHGEIL